ncbi:Aminotransferase, class V/Cysteine desulfurase, partial [Cynara cardunculus var. scolymus]
MSPMLLTQQTKVRNMSNNVSECGMLLADVIGHEKDVAEIGSTVDAKLRWLRSQIIGGMAEISTPFGRRKLTYADHTATGNTHTSDSYVGNRTTKMLHEATDFVKKCLGGTQDDALLFCGSGTTAAIKQLQEVMGIAIPSNLREKVINSCVGIQERWVVFVGPYEHHSNFLSWKQTLAEVIEIGLDDEGLIDMHDLRCQLEFYQATGRLMLGSFSACSNVTGICSDTQREDAGTPSIIQRVKAALAFQVKEYIGCEVIGKKEVDYIERAIKRLVKNPKIWVLGNTDTNSVVERQAILSFLVYTTTYSSANAARETRDKPLSGAFVAKLMNDLFGIQARGGCACAGPISFPYYMSNAEYEFILAAIEFVAIYGQRFLSLYQLNWNTGSWSLKDEALEETLVDCNLYVLRALQVIKNKTTEKVMDCETKDDGDTDFDKLYALYLEVAKHIGNKLLKFPSQRIVPNQIDVNH